MAFYVLEVFLDLKKNAHIVNKEMQSFAAFLDTFGERL
jgi:hypothetical protein